MTVKVVLVIVVAFLRGGHLTCTNQTKEAEEGDDIMLQWHLNSSINLQNYTFDVKRHDLKGEITRGRNIVFVCGRKVNNRTELLPRYRNRTLLIKEDLSRGVLTLNISSVQLHDTGKYKMFIPKLKVSCFIDLTVVKKRRRDNPSWTEPPRHSPTPSDPDAGRFDWKTLTYILVAAAVAVVVGLVLYFLDKQGKIQICKKNRRTRQEADEPERGHLRDQTEL